MNNGKVLDSLPVAVLKKNINQNGVEVLLIK